MKSIYQASILLLMITLISGVLYPAVVTGIGQLLWPDKSNGSLIQKDSKIVGSKLISQQFKEPKYFWPRPSASSFSALPSGASNLGPTSAALAKSIEERRSDLSTANNVAKSDIPMDLLTASGSGLDPHISIEAAQMQVNRIVKARGLVGNGKATIDKLIDDQLEREQLWILGEKRINVLLLNMGLDQYYDHNSLQD